MKKIIILLILTIILTTTTLAEIHVIDVPVTTTLNSTTNRLQINIAGGSNKVDVSTKEDFTQTYTLQTSKNITCIITEGVSEDSVKLLADNLGNMVNIQNRTVNEYTDIKSTNKELAIKLANCQDNIQNINMTTNGSNQYMYLLAKDALQETEDCRNRECKISEYNICKEERETLKKEKQNNLYLGIIIGLLIGAGGVWIYMRKPKAEDETEELQ